MYSKVFNFCMIYWSDGKCDSYRELNAIYCYNQLKRLVRYLLESGINCECRLYDFSINKNINFPDFHVPQLATKTFNKAAKLNYIINDNLTCDFLCLIDADEFIYEGDYKKLLQVLNDANELTINTFDAAKLDKEVSISVRNGNYVCFEDTDWWYAYGGKKDNGALPHNSGGLGGFFIISRELIARHKYDETFTTWGGEDGELLKRILESESSIGVKPIRDFTPFHLYHDADFNDKNYYNSGDAVKEEKANISFYGSHNAAIAIEKGGKIITVIEVERFLRRKNAGYGQYLVSQTRPYLIKEILKWVEKQYGISEYENCYYLNCDTVEAEEMVHYQTFIPAKNYIGGLHHLSHAACGFYQSPYKTATIISFDGGGNDGFFNIYKAIDRNTIIEIERKQIDLGFPYMSFGEYLGDIKLEADISIGNLVYSGKIMGLCSYGNFRVEWVIPIKEYYLSGTSGNNYKERLKVLGEKIGLTFDTQARLIGQDAYDLAKTSQIAFEEIFLDEVEKHISPSDNIVIVGGCAMNILLNTTMREKYDNVFVPPNPNDCGIAVGHLLFHMKPQEAVDITYSGLPIMDETYNMGYLENCSFKKTSANIIVDALEAGKIIGVVIGNSEHGARALGNRSIICDPTKPDMKDILNDKVKHRECYDSETEILTENGWVYFKDIKKGDIVATLNPNDNSLEYQEVKETVKKEFDGDMVVFENKRINLSVTPDHKVWARVISNHNSGQSDKNDFELHYAESLLNKEHKQLKAINTFNKNEDIDYFYFPKFEPKKGNILQVERIEMDTWLEFFGYWISEGSVTKDESHHYIYISQSPKSVFLEKINSCLEKLPYNFRWDGKKHFRVSNKQLFYYLKQLGKSKDKFIPRCFMNLSERQSKILFQALMDGDGHKRFKQYKYSTISKRLSDDVCELGVKLGYSVIVTEEHNNPNILYNVRLNTNTQTSWVSKNQIKKCEYKGLVYCVTVERHHILCVRRRGKVVFSGNCFRPFAPVVRLEDVSKYFEWENESRWMAFCPKVRPEWHDTLTAITHVDGTARVQTVTREQHPFLYDVLTELHNRTGVGVILNTSFNVDGKPILSTYAEAIEVYEKTEMDMLVMGDYVVSKHGF